MQQFNHFLILTQLIFYIIIKHSYISIAGYDVFKYSPYVCMLTDERFKWNISHNTFNNPRSNFSLIFSKIIIALHYITRPRIFVRTQTGIKSIGLAINSRRVSNVCVFFLPAAFPTAVRRRHVKMGINDIIRFSYEIRPHCHSSQKPQQLTHWKF